MMRRLLSRILPRVAAACVLLCAAAVAGAARPEVKPGGNSGGKPVPGFAEVNGTRLYYESAGEGPAVVLVHGGLADARLARRVTIRGSSHHPPVEKPKEFKRALPDFLRDVNREP